LVYLAIFLQSAVAADDNGKRTESVQTSVNIFCHLFSMQNALATLKVS